MQKIGRYTIPIVLLLVGTVALYPFLKYYVDPDAVAYFTIAKRYQSGDIYKAINGLWNPLSCWITAQFSTYLHQPLFISALITNTLGSILTLLASIQLVDKFVTNKKVVAVFGCFWGIYLAYANYYQLFCDIWGVGFLLCVVIIMLRKDYYQHIMWPIAAGLISACAMYAKAYSFYFAGLLAIIQAVIVWKSGVVTFKKALLTLILLGAVSIIGCLPWIFLMHWKYGVYSTSLAGKINGSWFLVGKCIPREGIHYIFPPTYNDSPSAWEDPYYYQTEWPVFYQSLKLFLRFLLRIAYNYFDFIKSANHFSFIYTAVWLVAIFLLIIKKTSFIIRDKETKLLFFSFLLYPIGFWTMHFETRFLWFTLPFAIIILYKILQTIPQFEWGNKTWIWAVIFLTFLNGAVLDTREILNVGKSEHSMAAQLKSMGIKGAFVANKPLDQSLERIAYFSECPMYFYEDRPEHLPSTKDLLMDAARYDVPYYFYFYHGAGADYQLLSPDGKPYEELTHGDINGLKVFRINK